MTTRDGDEVARRRPPRSTTVTPASRRCRDRAFVRITASGHRCAQSQRSRARHVVSGETGLTDRPGCTTIRGHRAAAIPTGESGRTERYSPGRQPQVTTPRHRHHAAHPSHYARLSAARERNAVRVSRSDRVAALRPRTWISARPASNRFRRTSALPGARSAARCRSGRPQRMRSRFDLENDSNSRSRLSLTAQIAG